jgi:hypothetical protein
MKIEGARIQDGVLALSAEGREFSLPDGVYSSPCGDSLTFRGGSIVEVLQPFDPDTASKDELEAHLRNLNDQLSQVGDDAQLANTDLQNAMQKQQRTVEVLSLIAKTTNDAAMAAIRKIGG